MNLHDVSYSVSMVKPFPWQELVPFFPKYLLGQFSYFFKKKTRSVRPLISNFLATLIQRRHDVLLSSKTLGWCTCNRSDIIDYIAVIVNICFLREFIHNPFFL